MRRIDNGKDLVILNKFWPLGVKVEVKTLDNGCFLQEKIDEPLPHDFKLDVVGFLAGIYTDDSDQKYVCLSMEIDGDPLFFCLLDKITECHELDHVKEAAKE